jgi:Flp pilus assembly protein TadD
VRAGGEFAPIAVSPPTLLVDPLLDQAYQAFQRNDLGPARDSYQRVLAREPTNRDALLGLAAIDVRTGNLEVAEARYLKLLEMDPRDSYAVAGLLALRGQLDPVASESRLKTLIANQPDAAHLHFSLGTQYARQSRWPEAQAAFFKAYSTDPENADYAFNLAVSLDQLRQKKPALEYYQRALALAENRPASFNRGQAQTRVQELSR